jgi:hypothetical protein
MTGFWFRVPEAPVLRNLTNSKISAFAITLRYSPLALSQGKNFIIK